MFKKSFVVTVASAVLLAACSTTPAPYTEDGEYVTGIKTGSSTAPRVLSGDVQMADNEKFAYGNKQGSAQQDLIAYASDRVYFNFDSASLDAQSQETLRRVADYIKRNSARIDGLTIEGHCDERGTREYNLALGDRRAVSVKKYLVGLGLDADKIKTISFGKERPVDGRHTEEAWQRNRRAVVVLR